MLALGFKVLGYLGGKCQPLILTTYTFIYIYSRIERYAEMPTSVALTIEVSLLLPK